MQSDPSNRSKVQEFEKHPELTKYIHKMAAFSTSLSPSEWSKFLNELNKALAKSLPPSGEEETAVGWISVEDRLPEAGKNVYTWDGHSMLIGHRITEMEREDLSDESNRRYIGVWWDGGNWFQATDKVTHWMPLPAPPSI